MKTKTPVIESPIGQEVKIYCSNPPKVGDIRPVERTDGKKYNAKVTEVDEKYGITKLIIVSEAQ